LIGTEVFGAAYAGGWAVAELLGLNYSLGNYGAYPCKRFFVEAGIYVMVRFFYIAFGVEPIVKRE
jgi:hypothetical protein